jgi:hypothetical protein
MTNTTSTTTTATDPTEARRMERTGEWTASAHSDDDRDIVMHRRDTATEPKAQFCSACGSSAPHHVAYVAEHGLCVI